jgi:Asp-tRNA(Asn)/Glu-tRNA(Gln) amidotransferase A subunit family amidase
MAWLLLLTAVAAGLLGVWWLFCSQRRVCYGPRAGRVRRPAQDFLDSPSLITYDTREIDIPSLSGKLFSFVMQFCFTRFGHFILVPLLMKGAKLYQLSGEYIPDKPVMNFRSLCPPPPEEDFTQENRQLIQQLLGEEGSEGDTGKVTSFRFPSVRDYYTAYKDGRCSPVEVAGTILEAIKRTNSMTPPLRAIVNYSEVSVKKMAQASSDRWKEGKPLSPLDGVPVAIKAEFFTEPYSFRCGSLFVPVFGEGITESPLVKNFKQAGALIIGMTNMHEFGTGVLGSNPNRFNLTARNPYNTGHYAGGSSSGSAVSVAAGLCPISLGADGGGSVRVPAALCGLFGIKPTHGLLESGGEMPVAPSLACPGPLCGTALDTIIAMDVLSRNSRGWKSLSLRGIGAIALGGLKVGIYRDFFNHCDESVRKACQSSLGVLEELGAVIVDVKIPEIEETRAAHLITIFSEFANGLACDVDKHLSVLNPETLLVLAPGFQFRAMDFLNAQKQRTRAVTFLKKIFKEVDVIVTPTTGCVAPKIDDDALSHGKSMGGVSAKLARYAGISNLAGNPAISVPIGLSSEGLPVGLQFMGRWYDETTLLSIAWVLERSGRFPPTKPSVFCDIIKTASKE